MSIRPTAAVLALQAALSEAFAADETLSSLTRGRIHDGPARAVVAPYLAFTGVRTRDFSSGDGAGVRVLLTIEAVRSDGDRKRALVILDAAIAVATTPTLTISDAKLVLVTASEIQVERVRAGDQWRARVTLDALIDG